MTTDRSTTPIRIVLADDHDIVRSGIKAELGADFEVVGEASDAIGAIDVVETHKPDLIVTDLNMGGGGGLEVIKKCATLAPVVILTVSDAERDLLDAVVAGAGGYLLKSTPAEELSATLRKAAEGEPVFSPSLAALVLGEFRRMSKASGADPLTEREREVLQLVARGHTYKEVGTQLFISPKTAENHVRNILGKLHLSRRSDLVRYAIERGIT